MKLLIKTNQKKMHKSSKQRDGIYSIFDKKNYHPTADEIYEIMRKNFPNISLATVYRNLDQLSQMGKILRIDIPNQPARYDGNIEDHYHIKCNDCGYIEDVWIEQDLVETLELNKAIPNFELLEYDINFTGTCHRCK